MQASELYRENEELIEHLIREGREANAQLRVQGMYATNRFTQLAALARKFRLAYWRSPSYNLTRMLMTLLICLFYGTVFWGRGRLPAEGESLAQAACMLRLDYLSKARMETSLSRGQAGLRPGQQSLEHCHIWYGVAYPTHVMPLACSGLPSYERVNQNALERVNSALQESPSAASRT